MIVHFEHSSTNSLVWCEDVELMIYTNPGLWLMWTQGFVTESWIRHMFFDLGTGLDSPTAKGVLFIEKT